MKLLANRILIESITTERSTPSGLILPEVGERLCTGSVIGVGDKVQTVRVGDTVQYRDDVRCTEWEGSLIVHEPDLITVR